MPTYTYTFHHKTNSSSSDGSDDAATSAKQDRAKQARARRAEAHDRAEIRHLTDELKHETRKFSLIMAITALLVLIFGLLYAFDIIPHREYTGADFDIPPYRSTHDQDQDGVDDQTDFLESVRAYLATAPSYQSKYYATGYPDDGYGVCTDVIAQGFKGAGYDLMALVDQDLRAHPEAYDVATPDKNIDFRRAKNLHTYLQRHAISLTTERDDIAEWQPGDIVVFADHIGVISDRRNRRGIPYLIHHYSPYQTTYEEDVLARYAILGHYRIS